MNPHEILGVPQNATQDQIKKAFHRKAHDYHPDKGGDPKKFNEVKAAYEALKNGSRFQTPGPNVYRRTPYGDITFGMVNGKFYFDGIPLTDDVDIASVLEKLFKGRPNHKKP